MYPKYPYSSKRSMTYGRAMALASNPAAAAAGRKILEAGGNAVDGAVAMAAAQTVAEPTSNGLGSDLFAIISTGGKLYGYNGSGKSPAAISLAAVKERGYASMPLYGIESVGVPGAVRAWADIHKKHGRLPFKEVLAPAIQYAEKGYVLSPTVARLWAMELKKRKANTATVYDGFWSAFSENGKAPEAGDILRLPHHARTLKAIAEDGGKSFYEGEIAEKIAAFMKASGGFMRAEDLKNHETLEVEPLSATFHGTEVWELPPNGQGITVLMALKILSRFDLKADDPASIHYTAEAIKRAMTDGAHYIADPDYMELTTEDLLSDAYAKKCGEAFGEKAQAMTYGNPLDRSTVYFCIGDKDGNMVSMIQSNYEGFGAGIVVPETGISLNNRLLNFSMEEGRANALDGSKRPYHTIIPGFLTRGGKPYGAFGVMGGFMQPQGHVQTLLQLLAYGRNPQSALDAPRFMWTGDKRIEMEADFDSAIIQSMKERGHDVHIPEHDLDMGRGQYMLYDRKRKIYVGGTEKRCDGTIAVADSFIYKPFPGK